MTTCVEFGLKKGAKHAF